MLSESTWQIDVAIDQPFQPELSEAWLESVVARAVSAALPGQAAGQVSLLVTGDATVRELNRRFRGLDEVT
ncbi:MAG TPA: hypothetical protein VI855_07955, partial [Dehalococcoidia bacterium]|nr:hypothetical protein [Dehalococcoidia bacterium]